MKITILAAGIAILLGLSAVYLYATPKPRETPQAVTAPPPRVSTPTGAFAWTTYDNPALGFSIDYPEDGTYIVNLSDGILPRSMHTGVEPSPVRGYIVNIGQSFQQSGNTYNFRILVTPDPHILTSMPESLEISSSTRAINGLLFQKLTEKVNLPNSDAYAYVLLHNGQYYVFESLIVTPGPARHGLDNPLFEHMMASLLFK